MTSGNSQANYITKRIHHILAKLNRTFDLEKNYVVEDDPRKGILAAAAFTIHSILRTTNKKSPGQVLFGQDMIVPIEYVANWILIYQSKKTLIDKNIDK